MEDIKRNVVIETFPSEDPERTGIGSFCVGDEPTLYYLHKQESKEIPGYKSVYAYTFFEELLLWEAKCSLALTMDQRSTDRSFLRNRSVLERCS